MENCSVFRLHPSIPTRLVFGQGGTISAGGRPAPQFQPSWFPRPVEQRHHGGDACCCRPSNVRSSLFHPVQPPRQGAEETDGRHQQRPCGTFIHGAQLLVTDSRCSAGQSIVAHNVPIGPWSIPQADLTMATVDHAVPKPVVQPLGPASATQGSVEP